MLKFISWHIHVQYNIILYSGLVFYAVHRYDNWVERPGDDTDIANALLAAAKANHVKILEIILQIDDNAFQNPNRLSVLHVADKLSGFYTWKVAVLEGLSCVFEVWTLENYAYVIYIMNSLTRKCLKLATSITKEFT